MPIKFEIHQNGQFLSRHTAETEAEKAKIVETIRFSKGRGVLRKSDGITVVMPTEVKTVDERFVSVVAPEAGYVPPSKPKAQPKPKTHHHRDGIGLNLGSLLSAAGFKAKK